MIPDGKPGSDRRSQNRAQEDGRLIQTVSKSPFLRDQIFVNGFARGGDATSFGEAQPGAAGDEAAQATGESGGNAGERPQAEGQTNAAVQANAVDEQAGKRGGSGVGQ